MSVTKIAALGGLAAAAVFVALWWHRDNGAMRAQRSTEQANAVVDAVTVESTAPAAAPAATSIPRQADTSALRPTEAELRARVTEESYARIGGALVDYLVGRGLARADGEPVVRRFLDDNMRCFFDALRAEADAQSVSYDSLLDALEAELYDTDGPLLGALIDMRAVLNRVVPCGLTAAQQAGIDPAALPESTRAAIVRGVQR
jgi:hypothetical protein